eukprot:1191356-Prorocentrum_minimum.AAC.1
MGNSNDLFRYLHPHVNAIKIADKTNGCFDHFCDSAMQAETSAVFLDRLPKHPPGTEPRARARDGGRLLNPSS